ncbi:MAG: ABC transporter ATP-binding protein [Acidimicrobiales bacterium]|nr:ABC transporter ATP-binding protein [Acidimicrobiales bacterium]HRW38367.1 ABC transporter ATP-binding protein [Aquihabitans sp.]
MSALLEVGGLTVKHGGLIALDDVSLTVAEGQVVGLIGPNGAGKTTFIDALTGFTAPARGHVHFEGRDLTDAPPHERSLAGLVRTFQSLELFDDLSVRDNLLVAAHPPTLWSTITDLFWPKSHDSAETHGILELLDLLPIADRLPTELSNGERHVVALGRALVSSPKLLLLDEPAAGLDPSETAELTERLRRLPEIGTSVLVVDHDMSLILGVCDEVHVLDFGRLVASGPPEAIRTDPTVIAAYLGRSA